MSKSIACHFGSENQPFFQGNFRPTEPIVKGIYTYSLPRGICTANNNNNNLTQYHCMPCAVNGASNAVRSTDFIEQNPPACLVESHMCIPATHLVLK